MLRKVHGFKRAHRGPLWVQRCFLSTIETWGEPLPNEGVTISCENKNLTGDGKLNDWSLGIPRMATQGNGREVVDPTYKKVQRADDSFQLSDSLHA